MSRRAKARINLAVNCGIAAGGTILAAIDATATWRDLGTPMIVLGAMISALGAVRAAYGPSPATGE